MQEGTIQDKLSRFLLNYRTTPRTTTGVTPAELLMKRKLQTKLDLIVPNTASLVRQKQTHDHHAKHRDFEANDPVFIKDFSSPKSWQKGTVVQTTGPVSALVENWMVELFDDIRTTCRGATAKNQQSLVLKLWFQESCQWQIAQQTQPNRVAQPSSPTEPVVSSSDAQDRRLPACFKDYEL